MEGSQLSSHFLAKRLSRVPIYKAFIDHVVTGALRILVLLVPLIIPIIVPGVFLVVPGLIFPLVVIVKVPAVFIGLIIPI